LGASSSSLHLQLGLSEVTVLKWRREFFARMSAAYKLAMGKIKFEGGCILEADEAAFGKSKVTRGQVIFHQTTVIVGLVERGAPQTLMLWSAGTRSTKKVKRFPKLPKPVWVKIWKTLWEGGHLPAKGKINLHTDGDKMYVPNSDLSAVGREYTHHACNHSAKEFWYLDTETNTEVTSNAIEACWKNIKELVKKWFPRSGIPAESEFAASIAFAAAFLMSQRGSLDERLREVIQLFSQ